MKNDTPYGKAYRGWMRDSAIERKDENKNIGAGFADPDILTIKTRETSCYVLRFEIERFGILM